MLIAKQSVWKFFKNEHIYIQNCYLFQNSHCGIHHDVFCQCFYWNRCLFTENKPLITYKKKINQQLFLKFKLKKNQIIFNIVQAKDQHMFATTFQFSKPISEWSFFSFLSMSKFSIWLTRAVTKEEQKILQYVSELIILLLFVLWLVCVRYSVFWILFEACEMV